MKRITIVMLLFAGSIFTNTAFSQVNIRVNIGSQPVWGPEGYDYAEYYYLPEMDMYYHVPDRQFVFFDGRNWTNNSVLPSYYNCFNLYNTYKVVINDPQPYLRNNYYHSQYRNWQGRRQENIYNSHDSRYFAIEGHPDHNRWMEDRRNDNRYGNDHNFDNNNRGGNNSNFGSDRRDNDNRNNRGGSRNGNNDDRVRNGNDRRFGRRN